MNPADWKIREDRFKEIMLLQFPSTLRVKTVIVRKQRAQRDSAEKLQKIDSMNKESEHRALIISHEAFAMHIADNKNFLK